MTLRPLLDFTRVSFTRAGFPQRTGPQRSSATLRRRFQVPFLTSLFVLFLVSLVVQAQLPSPKTINGSKLPFNVILVLPEKESNNDKFGITMDKAKPVVDISVQDVIKSGRMPPNFINFTYHDSRYWEDAILAERWSTVGVVNAYCAGRLDAILGFADSYSLATVAKVSAGFGNGVPVITTAGMTSMLGAQKTYPFLTRMQGSYRQMADSIYKLIAYKGDLAHHTESRSAIEYKNLIFMYHDKRRAVNRPQAATGEQHSEDLSSHCYFSLYAIKMFFTEKSVFFKEAWKIQTPSLAFDEEIERTTDEVKSWLKLVSELANALDECVAPLISAAGCRYNLSNIEKRNVITGVVVPTPSRAQTIALFLSTPAVTVRCSSHANKCG
ncbi:hypothetical protein Tcan_11167 [Toxocara canis]|uniref:Receptor ligand binding region domain-containing protein n=1 Tax=Toxocara canis TaxID=6265 RepID=A0A0B2VCC6_TOXCA|nr:hypothetical protein Tcan_11167 [Toxocara canis]